MGATDEADLKAAAVETVDIFESVIRIVEEEMNGGAFMQLKEASTVTEVFAWIVQAQSCARAHRHSHHRGGDEWRCLHDAVQEDQHRHRGLRLDRPGPASVRL